MSLSSSPEKSNGADPKTVFDNQPSFLDMALSSNNVAAESGRANTTMAMENTSSSTTTDQITIVAMNGRSNSTLTVEITTGDAATQETVTVTITEESRPKVDVSTGFDHYTFVSDGSSVSAGASVWESESGTVSVLNAEANASAGWKIGTDGATAFANAGASVSVLDISGSYESDTGILRSASGSVTGLTAQAEASAGVRVGPDGIEAEAKIGASVSVLEADGNIQLGDGNLGLNLGAEVTVLSASAEAGGKIGYARNEETGAYELNAYLNAEVMAVVASGSVCATFSVGGVDVSGKATVYVGVGARFKVGIVDGKLEVDIGAALGIGFSIRFSIGFNDEFIKNIRRALTARGRNYAANNPHIRVDTALLRDYARRVDRVNTRLSQLDRDIRRLHTQVRPIDQHKILGIRIMTGTSLTLAQVRNYLNNTASRFDEAERSARSFMGV